MTLTRSTLLGPGFSAFLVAAIAVTVYSSSLPGTFHYDDTHAVTGNPSVRDPGLILEYFTDPQHFSGIEMNRMYRPVLLVTYLLNYVVVGYAPFFWHLTNVLLHALAAALVVLLTARLRRVLGGNEWLPLLAGLVFALHPVNSEVVNYVSARSCAIATIGFAGALILHVAWTRGRAATIRGAPRRALLAAASLALFAVGLGGKETAAAVVPSVFLLELLDPANGSLLPRLRRAVVRTIPVLALFLAYFLVLRPAVLGSSVEGVTRRLTAIPGEADLLTGAGRTVLQNVLTQARVFWLYVFLLLFPTGLALDHHVDVSLSLGEPAVIVSLVALLVTGVLLLAASRRAPILTFAGGIVIFGLAPTWVIPLNVVMNEHRLYLPGVGIAILLAWPLARIVAWRPRAGLAVGGAVAACWLVAITLRNLEWQEPEALWRSNVRTEPRSHRAHNQLGAEVFERAARLYEEAAATDAGAAVLPLVDRAIEEYRVAADLYPRWYDPYWNLGIAFNLRGRITGRDEDWRRAIENLGAAIERADRPSRARYWLATTYGAWGKYDIAIPMLDAIAEADRSAETGKRNKLYLLPLAQFHRDDGDMAGAEGIYREIVDVAPNEPAGYIGIARCQVDTGRRKEAVATIREFLARRKDDPEAWLAVAEFFVSLDPPERGEAAKAYRRALALGHPMRTTERQRYLEE